MEPIYAVTPHRSGISFFRDTAEAEKWAEENQGRLVPAVQVAPEIRAEGRDWMAAR